MAVQKIVINNRFYHYKKVIISHSNPIVSNKYSEWVLRSHQNLWNKLNNLIFYILVQIDSEMFVNTIAFSLFMENSNLILLVEA